MWYAVTREGCWCSRLAHGEEIRRTNSTGSSETCSHGELWEKITDPSGLYSLAHSPECLHYPRATAGNHPHITRRICSVVKLCPCNQRSATTASNTWTRWRGTSELEDWGSTLCNIADKWQACSCTHPWLHIIYVQCHPMKMPGRQHVDFQEIPWARAIWN